MHGRAGFCDTCCSIAYEINAYYQSLKAIFSNEEEPSHPRKDKKISLGTMKDLQNRSECPSCKDIVRKIVNDGNKPSVLHILNFEFDQQQGLYIRPDPWLERPLFKLWRLEYPTLAHEVGRAFDFQQIDINLLHQWITCCHASHGDRCNKIELPLPLRQIYLIDVEEGCLISAEVEIQYVALSYVWGDSETLQLTKSNLMHLKKPRSIDANIDSTKIPNTIQDAMRLVSLLGEKYLWVDRLCIIQDELDTKQLCLNSMASIYENAYFTIVAADGQNADYGLRGIGQSSQARPVSCDTVRFPCETDMVLHRPQAPCEDSPWESRAWTFQEGLFSRRILIFNGTVSWCCRTAFWREYVNSPTEDIAYAVTHELHPHRTHLVASNPTWPDLDRWATMVEEFNKRELTFDEDVINAFSGATSVFNSRFSGGILWGIPEMFFDHCIVWKPMKVLRRRAYNYSLSENPFPSWSWIAWEGDIVLEAAPLILDNHPRIDDQTIKIRPVARWYKSGKPPLSLSSVKNSYHSLQQTYGKAPLDQVPTGWTQGQYADGTFYYTENSVSTVRFHCLIPLANEDANPLFDDNGRYLHLKSQRANLFLGQELEDIRDNWTTCPACLVDNEGNWAGTIRLNMSRSNSLPKAQPCELIALSLATAVNSGDYLGVLDEWNMPGRPHDSEFYQFYYVMWIEWEKGIAYRKAIGTVYKSIWEDQVREDIDVVLG